jgi:DNA (cytosine-5)-methyltransferase 1
METSNKLTGEQLSLWTSSAADTPANHSAPQENDEAQTTHDTFGLGYETPLAHYDPDSQSWKTLGDISLWGEQPLLENLPKSGMTRSGVLYQQPDWVRPIDAIASSLLHTPTATMNQMSPSMVSRSGWWPTPTAVTRPMEGNVRMYRAKIEAGEMTEAEAEAILGKSVWEAQGKVPAVWPTPTVDDAKNVNPKTNRFRGLVAAVNETMWPTPTFGKLAGGTGGMQQIEAKYLAGEITSEERRAMRAGNGGKLNPMWVEWLMGFPIGWTDLED